MLLATVCLFLLASPAIAGKKTDSYRPPEGVPMMSAWGGGWWFEYQDTGDPFTDVTWWQAYDVPPSDDPEDPGLADFWGPIPKDTEVFGTLGWINTTYGQTTKASKVFAITVDVTGLDGNPFSQHISPAEVETMWTGARAYDEWWQVFAGGSPPLFNPKIMAGVYINRPNVPLGPFPAEGWYHFYWFMDQVMPITDHFFYDWDPEDGVADSPGATTWPPGSNTMLFEFDFYVE